MIYEACRKRKLLKTAHVKQDLRILNPDMEGGKEREEIHIRKFYTARFRQVLLLIFIGDLLALCLSVSRQAEGTLKEGKYIVRNPQGGGSRETELQAQIGENKEKQDFTLMIEEQRYEDALIKEMAKEVKKALPESILGSNGSLEEVRSNLNLLKSLEDYPFHIAWESDNYSCVYSDGSVINDDLEEQGVIVNLTAILTYEDYKEEYIFPVHILPPAYSRDELLKKKIYELLKKQEESDRKQEKVELPEKVEGMELIWRERKEEDSKYLLILSGVGALLIYLLGSRRLKEGVEERNRQMLLDYPQVVSKLTLYMGAGMTIRNAFKKIAFDYNREKEKSKNTRYVYEEMLLACHEMDSGISEAVVYEHFGKRCRLPQYARFVNLLIQNLKKGSNGLLEALRQEAKSAFEERKNTAKKMGEEAGTKLLLPMMLMLGIVMLLIIIPAYFSFSL